MPEPVTVLGPAYDNALLAALVAQQQQVMLVATFGGMLLLLMLESLWPRRADGRLPMARWLNNWLLASLNFLLVLWIVQAASGSGWLQAVRALASVPPTVPPAATILLTLVLVELGVYWLHRLFHASPLLWRIHAVHHTDTEVDVTTSHRHHTLEALMTSLLFLPVFVLLDLSAVIAVVVGLLRLAVILLSHSNLYLPRGLDRVLRWLIVTPDFHRLHHSSDRRYTNSNYGGVVPWFDYLFGTARSLPFDAHPDMTLGLEHSRAPADTRLDRLLLMPFIWVRHTQARRGNPADSVDVDVDAESTLS